SGPTSSGSFALTLIRGSLQRAIPGPVQLTRHPCRVPPGSASGLSRHLRRTLRRQCHRDRKAHLKQLNQSRTACHPIGTRNPSQCPPPAAGPALAANGGLASQTSRISPANIQPSR
ncbi:hypothetical protein CCL23_27180, partial [Pseudomonas syringae]